MSCCFQVLSHRSVLYSHIRKLVDELISFLVNFEVTGNLILLFFQARLELELKKTPKLRKFWNLIKKNDEKMDPKAREQYVLKLRPMMFIVLGCGS